MLQDTKDIMKEKRKHRVREGGSVLHISGHSCGGDKKEASLM